MYLKILKSKIHRATITDADLHYEGSISIDEDLMEAAQLFTNEKVQVWDVTNGNRLETYALPAKRGSGEICINGAAAHLVKKLDLVIITSFALMSPEEAKHFKPATILVDANNRILKKAIL